MKRLIRWAAGQGRTILLATAIVAAFAGAIFYVWRQFEGQILSSQDYWLTLDRVEISPPPDWIRTDIRAEVFRDASLDGPLSILDPGLVQRVANAFSLHPWVADVRGVSKTHPARVRVDLVYRRPVCMVQSCGRLLPVDAEGVLLPSEDFSPLEAEKYPRLDGVATVPVGPPGTRWGDARVLGGAEIAAAFGLAWQRLGLDRIVPSEVSELGSRDEPTYELFTRGGTRILWGRAPGTDMPGEVPPADKVARLEKYFSENGTLDGIDGPQQLDVRSLRSMYVSPATAGKPQKVLQ